MAYIEPRTWTDTEFVDDDIMNGHIRDNFRAMGPHLIARKPTDESLPSSTTFQPDDHLILPVLASEHWLCEFGVWFSGSTSGNLKIQFTFPSGGVIGLAVAAFNAAGTMTLARFTGSASPSTSENFICLGSSGRTYLGIRGNYVNGGTAGNVVMEWAQNTSNATPTVVHLDSAVWGVKLA